MLLALLATALAAAPTAAGAQSAPQASAACHLLLPVVVACRLPLICSTLCQLPTPPLPATTHLPAGKRGRAGAGPPARPLCDD